MKQLDWKLQVTANLKTFEFISVELYHPIQRNRHRVRRDTAKRLLVECRVCGRLDDETAILCYDHDGADKNMV